MSAIRNQSGFQLIETLVALILGSMYCLALLQVCAESMRVTTTSSNKQAADLIAQTVLDATKQTSYSFLPVGSYSIPLDSPGESPHPLPVNLDMTNLTWVGTVKSFPGVATLEVSTGPDQFSKIATVTVQWSDGQVTGKTTSTMCVIHQTGTWYWHALPGAAP